MFAILPSLFLAITLIATPVAEATPTGPFQDTYDNITGQMVQLRGLSLVQPIPVEVKSRSQLQEEQQASLATDYPAHDQAVDMRVLVAFGLIDSNVNIGQLYASLYGEQVAGYYDSSTGDMVVVASSSSSELTASDKATFAHETTHGLQDQHFDLSSFDEARLKGTSDESLAITSLIEGDATLAQLDYLLANPAVARAYLEEINSGSMSNQVFDSAPAIISQTLILPYVQGEEFVQALYDKGGWAAVNDAYANPPTTTEQILHPEKYFAGEQAIPVSLSDLAQGLGAGWTTIDTDTMGEYQMSILLGGGPLKQSQVTQASEGWGGDAYTVCTSGNKTVVAWASAWDTEKDAQQFARALGVREGDRLGADVKQDGYVVTITGNGVVVQITIAGSSVTYLHAPDMDTLEKAIGALH